MDNLEILAKALEYMEQHLETDIRTEEIARACYCSKSTLEKLFRFVNHISVRDFLIRRRMTKAARLLVECPGVPAGLELFTLRIPDEEPGFGTFPEALYASGVRRCVYEKS